MVEEAWNEYRGWAKRARTLQSSARRWSRTAFACSALAAIFGAAAAQATGGSVLGKALAFAAAVVAAVTPVIGREIMSTGSETRWIRARATAEAIKSECFRFAAQLGDYAGSAAKSAFVARRNTLAEPAERAGLTPLGDPIPKGGDARCPPVPLSAQWYMENRLDEQMRYYAKSQTENEQAAAQLRTISFGSAIVAAILGVAGSTFGQERFTPWIGVMTTITVAVMAYGLLDRRQYLAATYGAMATRLSRVKETFSGATVDLAALVTTTEDLLQSEHAAWSDHMTKTVATPAKPGQ
jgi:cation transporter-like permease